jgi:hypothetical protein
VGPEAESASSMDPINENLHSFYLFHVLFSQSITNSARNVNIAVSLIKNILYNQDSAVPW